LPGAPQNAVRQLVPSNYDICTISVQTGDFGKAGLAKPFPPTAAHFCRKFTIIAGPSTVSRSCDPKKGSVTAAFLTSTARGDKPSRAGFL
jgi:hypothetical protein